MGFDVTAANVIFFIAALSVASAALGAYWKSSDHVEEARREEDQRADERAHTNMTVTTALYSAAPTRFTVNVKNTGSTVIEISDLAYFIDGSLVASTLIEDIDVVGEITTTDLWLPLETLDIDFRPVTASPTYFQIVAPNGAKANWRS